MRQNLLTKAEAPARPEAKRPDRSRHIVFVISSLSSGGAERIVTTMANYWADRGDRVSVVTWYDLNLKPPFYPLHPGVEVHSLNIATPSANVYQRIRQTARRTRALRRKILALRPDVVISFVTETNVTTLLSTLATRIPVIVSERTDPGACPPIGQVMEALRRRLYPRAAAVVVQTERAAGYFNGRISERIRVVPNPVSAPPVSAPPVSALAEAADSSVKVPRPCLVAVGRLGTEKGFDVLLEVFARLCERHPDWSLVILGEGPLRPDLEAQRDRLGLAGKALMPGRVANPSGILRQSDVFALSSVYEGFPNALCEAMAAGLPVVAMDCPSGPREIIRDGIDGVLVPHRDAEALFRALDALMASPEERERLARRAPEVLQRFSLDRVMAMWEDVMAPLLVGSRA